MTIEVYSKKGCGICESVKEKLDLLGLPFESHDIEQKIEPHAGWREDGSLDVMAAYAMIHNHLPVIRIDGDFTDYAGAMRRLKRREPVGA